MHDARMWDITDITTFTRCPLLRYSCYMMALAFACVVVCQAANEVGQPACCKRVCWDKLVSLCLCLPHHTGHHTGHHTAHHSSTTGCFAVRCEDSTLHRENTTAITAAEASGSNLAVLVGSDAFEFQT